MITTVTVTTVTTVTAITAMGLGAVLSFTSAGVLVFLLATRELALARGTYFSSRLGSFTAVAIAPLLFVFGLTLVIEISKIIG